MATDVSRENEKDGMIMKNYSEDVNRQYHICLLYTSLMMKINGKKQVEIFFSHMVSSQRCSVENIWMS